MDELGISKKEFKKFSTMTYSALLKLDASKLLDDYDIIVADEYHRGGAEKWGEKLKNIKEEILKSDLDKKIIGLTATSMRYLDNERKMDEEQFDTI